MEFLTYIYHTLKPNRGKYSIHGNGASGFFSPWQPVAFTLRNNVSSTCSQWSSPVQDQGQNHTLCTLKHCLQPRRTGLQQPLVEPPIHTCRAFAGPNTLSWEARLETQPGRLVDPQMLIKPVGSVDVRMWYPKVCMRLGLYLIVRPAHCRGWVD